MRLDLSTFYFLPSRTLLFGVLFDNRSEMPDELKLALGRFVPEKLISKR